MLSKLDQLFLVSISYTLHALKMNGARDEINSAKGELEFWFPFRVTEAFIFIACRVCGLKQLFIRIS